MKTYDVQRDDEHTDECQKDCQEHAKKVMRHDGVHPENEGRCARSSLYEYDQRLAFGRGRTAYGEAGQDKGYEPCKLVERVAAM